MSKTKKTFDKELMYKKIMPSNFKRTSEQEEQDFIDKPINEQIRKEDTVFKNKEIKLISNQKDEEVLYNIMENLVIGKLDGTLKKMNCCKCDRCKEDVIALALNNLKPLYIVSSRENINEKIKEYDSLGIEVTTAVLKAALIVRKNPRH